MRLTKLHKNRCLFLGIAVIVMCISIVALAAPVSAAAKGPQKTFATPEDAVNALLDALKANNTKKLLSIFGPGSEALVSSGDKVRDRAARERFIKDFEEVNTLEKQGEGKVVLYVGRDNFPFPIPIVKEGTTWHFDRREGKEELLKRRVGGNELNVINSLHAFVDAQREYALKDRDGNGTMEFAQKFMSSKGKHDGLYWNAKEGEEESPLGPFVARAAVTGYGTKERTEKPAPFHGYYFKILKAQGPHAIGGAYDYVVKGKMLLGFAFLAYPAKYGASGIMTFAVNQEGVIYQKDLGKDTSKVAKGTKVFNPDSTWAKVEDTQK